MNTRWQRLMLAMIWMVPQWGLAQDIVDDNQLKLGVGVNGEVAIVNVNAGDQVKAGQVLLQLKLGPYQSSVEAADAEVEYRKRMLDEAHAAFGRAEELYQEGSLSAVERTSSELELLQAKWRYAASVEKRSFARSRLSLATVVAPVDGTIVRRLTHPGERVITGQQAPVQLILEPANN